MLAVLMETKCLGRMSKWLLLPTVSQYYFTRLSRNLYGPVLISSYPKRALECVKNTFRSWIKSASVFHIRL